MSVLVTGGGGFVGSHLVAELDRRGEDVVALIHSPFPNETRVPGENITFVEGDIRDREFVFDLVEGCEEVYHVAALQNYLSPTMAEFNAVNVHGTENVMAAALEHGVERVVYTSSQVTIGEHTSDRMDESSRHGDFFNTGYSLTKYKGEKIAFEYGTRGLDVRTVHPTLIYGPREVNNLLGLIRGYIEPPVRFVGFADTLFNFVYIDDVVEGHIAAMKRGERGERYLLGGEQRSIGEFLELVDELTGTDKPVVTVPKPLVRFAAYRVEPIARRFGIELPVAEGQVRAMEFDSNIDTTKARHELGLGFTPLAVGLPPTLEWYRQEGLLRYDGPVVGPEPVAEDVDAVSVPLETAGMD